MTSMRSLAGLAATGFADRRRLGLLGRRLSLAGRSTGVDLCDHRPDLDRVSLRRGDLDQLAFERRRDLGVDFVRDDLDERLVALDEVALVLQPPVDGALGDRLAELGHLDWRKGHALESSVGR